MKICKKCNEPKGLFDFSAHPTTKDRLQAYCKPCNSVACKEFAQRNPGRKRKQRYGLHQEDYEALLLKQGFRCAICDMIMARPNVDHDHKTKAVRGLLCRHCNLGLGHFFDNRQLLSKAAQYLAFHGN